MNAIFRTLDSMSGAFVQNSFAMLIQSTILILLLLAVDFILRKKARAIMRYGMWLLVLVKLVLPTTLALPTGAGYWLAGGFLTPQLSQSAEQDTETQSAAPVAKEAEYIATATAAPAEEALPAVQALPRDVHDYAPRASYNDSSITSAPLAAEPQTVQQPSVAVVTAARPFMTWQSVVLLVWLVVAGAMVLLLVQRFMFVRGLLRQASPAGEDIQPLLDECKRIIGISAKRRVEVRLSANSASPAICGLLHPVILMPEFLPAKLGRNQMKAVLLHELVHLKRGDLWINTVQTLLQVIYFYNPLLWFANAIIRRVREQAVDEAVMVAMGREHEDYPQTLLNVAGLALSRPALSLRLVGVVESKSALAGRIKHILNHPLPKSSKLGIAGAAMLLTFAAVFLPMAGASQKPATNEPKTEITDAGIADGKNSGVDSQKILETKTLPQELTTNGSASSNSIIECTMNIRSKKDKRFLNLDTGELYNAPAGLDGVKDPNQILKIIEAWAKTSGADICSEDAIWGIDMVVFPVDNKIWDDENLSDLSLLEILNASGSTPALMPNINGNTTVYFFKTRKGSIGLLQHAKADIKNETIKVKYKLLKKADAKSKHSKIENLPKMQPVSSVVTKEMHTIMEAFKADVVKLSEKYPQFAAAKDIPITQDGWMFMHDYRDLYKDRYENTGPFPVGIGLRFMPMAESNRQTGFQPDPQYQRSPHYRWDGLGLVGWVELHTDDKTNSEVVTALQETISRAMRKIGSLNRREFDARLPEDIKRQRSELLAKASADICNGLHKLAEQFPQLKRGYDWNHIKASVGQTDRVSIHLQRYHGGKGGTEEYEIPKDKQFGILVVVKPQPDEMEQLATFPMYPALGLVGQVHASAGDPKLNEALNKLIADSLAPLVQLNAKAAGKQGVQLSDKAFVEMLVELFFRSNYRDIKERKTIGFGDLQRHADGSVSIDYKYDALFRNGKKEIIEQTFTFDRNGDFASVKAIPAPVMENFGPANQGLQVGLRPLKSTWQWNQQVPELQLEVYNGGQIPVGIYHEQMLYCNVEVDGQWYIWEKIRFIGPEGTLSNGKKDKITITLTDSWVLKSASQSQTAPATRKPLVLSPGKHIVRVSFLGHPMPGEHKDDIRCVSNPVEIDIQGKLTETSVSDTAGTIVPADSAQTVAEKFVAALTKGNLDEYEGMLSSSFKDNLKQELAACSKGMDFSKAGIAAQNSGDRTSLFAFYPAIVRETGKPFYFRLTLERENSKNRWLVTAGDFTEKKISADSFIHGYPQIVRTTPAAFADDVSPELGKITVTFDRKMMNRSWSWTGGGDTFPQSGGAISYDTTCTTCTMPVKLQPGKVYWVGINSPSHKNFKTDERIPARRYVILFATKGADGKPTPIPQDMLQRAKKINAAAQPK